MSANIIIQQLSILSSYTESPDAPKKNSIKKKETTKRVTRVKSPMKKVKPVSKTSQTNTFSKKKEYQMLQQVLKRLKRENIQKKKKKAPKHKKTGSILDVPLSDEEDYPQKAKKRASKKRSY